MSPNHETPTAAFSLRIRVRLANQPGMLGRLAVAIGEAGGNIAGARRLRGQAREPRRGHRRELHERSPPSRVIVDAIGALEGIDLLEWEDRTFAMHQGGKIEVLSLAPVGDRDDLSMAYTPGVARVCTAIADQPERVHELTIKRNTVAIVTDGTAVLGLGDIGPAAALPVMEGKALLFKEFAGVDAFPALPRRQRRR